MFFGKHKTLITSLVSLLILIFASVSFADAEVIDTTDISEGMFKIDYTIAEDQQLMVLVEKGEQQGVYQYVDNGSYPLNFGEGDYTLSLFERIEGNSYKGVAVKRVNVAFEQEMAPYLASTELVSFDKSPVSVEQAEEWCQGLESDSEKAEAIYQNLITTLNYDYEKANTLTATYFADSDETLMTQEGICLDFATLYGVMLRSQDIPTKIVMGHKSDIDSYHAWNQVYLLSQGGWVNIDVTYGQSYIDAGQEAPYIIDDSEYTVEKFY